MQKWNWIYLVMAILALPVQAQSSFGQAFLPNGLKDIIQLQEQTENGETLNLLLGTIPQDVDVNSVIKINISAGQLLQHSQFKSNVSLSPDHLALLDAADELQISVELLIKGMRLSAELTKMVKNRASDEFNVKAAKLQVINRKSSELIKKYLTLIAQPKYSALIQHDVAPIKRVNTAALEGRLAAVIATEIKLIITQLEKTGQTIVKNSRPIGLNLVACFSPCNPDDPTSRIHLEHYDSLELGVPKPIDKLNVVPSPEQVGKLKVTYAKTNEIAKKLNEIKNSREQLKSAMNIILKKNGIDLTKLKNATSLLKEELENLRSIEWGQQTETMLARVNIALESSPTPAQRSQLEKVKFSINSMNDTLAPLSIELRNISSLIRAFEPRLDKGVVLNGDDPLGGLLALIDQVDEKKKAFKEIKMALSSFKSNANNFTQTVKDLATEMKALITEIKKLDPASAVKDELQPVADNFKKTTLAPLKTALKGINDEINVIKMALSSRTILDHQKYINNYAATEIEPPDTSYFIPVKHAKNTWLDLRTIDKREDGSGVIFQASLYTLKEENGNYIPTRLLDREVQTFRTLKFGFYGDYSVGLAYVQSKNILAGQTEENRGFAPQVTWLLKHRSWREAHEPAHYTKKWHEHIGVGFHSIALDLDNDNETEIGLGVTFSLFEELVQIGYGIDLSNDEQYYFIATRLFDF